MWLFNVSRKAWCDAVNLNVKGITRHHVICDAHFPDHMFTFNVSKQLNVWAVPNLDVANDTDRTEYINDIKDELIDEKDSILDVVDATDATDATASKVILEIQALKELQYSCDMCVKKFSTREERNAHIDAHFKTYECPTCEETFVGDRQFEHHRLSNKCVAKKHIAGTTYECFVCHKASFFTVRSLRVHYNQQHKVKPQKSAVNICEYCHKTFSNVYILKTHISQIHLQEVKFVCGDCGKTFNRSSNLKWHQLIHQNELPCVCKICGKSFRTLSGLNLHKRTHTGEKPYACDLCEKAYAYNTDLKRHKRSAHGIIDKEFHCSKCQQVFYEPKFLRKHMQKVHE